MSKSLTTGIIFGGDPNGQASWPGVWMGRGSIGESALTYATTGRGSIGESAPTRATTRDFGGARPKIPTVLADKCPRFEPGMLHF